MQPSTRYYGMLNFWSAAQEISIARQNARHLGTLAIALALAAASGCIPSLPIEIDKNRGRLREAQIVLAPPARVAFAVPERDSLVITNAVEVSGRVLWTRGDTLRVRVSIARRSTGLTFPVPPYSEWEVVLSPAMRVTYGADEATRRQVGGIVIGAVVTAVLIAYINQCFWGCD